MEIKPIRWPDFLQIYSLWERAGLKLASIETERSDFLEMIRLNGDSCQKLVINKSIIGVGFGTWNGRRAWVYHFAVDPYFHNKGYGTMLIASISRSLKKRGAKQINLGVLVINKQVAPFYEKQGFVKLDDAKIFGREL